MVQKAPVRNEHVEAFLAERFEEIPVELMPLVEARVQAMLANGMKFAAAKPAKSEKPLKLVTKSAEEDDNDLNDNFA
jgi:hypothetical protein